MVYDSVEKVAALLTANFDTDLGALCVAKSVTTPAAAVIVKRMDANLHIAVNGVLPAVCIYGRAATTQAKQAGKRDNRTVVSVDYFDRASVANLPTLLAQVELAAEAVLKTVDRCVGDSTTGIWGGGLGDGSVTVELSDREDAPEGEFQRLATVTFAVNDRDEV